MTQSFMDRRYPVKVWAGTASAAILAVTVAASLWVFFGQASPLALEDSHNPGALHASLKP